MILNNGRMHSQLFNNQNNVNEIDTGKDYRAIGTAHLTPHIPAKHCHHIEGTSRSYPIYLLSPYSCFKRNAAIILKGHLNVTLYIYFPPIFLTNGRLPLHWRDIYKLLNIFTFPLFFFRTEHCYCIKETSKSYPICLVSPYFCLEQNTAITLKVHPEVTLYIYFSPILAALLIINIFHFDLSLN